MGGTHFGNRCSIKHKGPDGFAVVNDLPGNDCIFF
jgi:hypothetical protein